MSLSKFESMLKTNAVYFFDTAEFETIVEHYLNVGKHSLAKKALQLGLEQHPEAIALKLLRVEIFVFDGHIEDAVKLLTEIEAIEPHNDEVFIQKATILSKHKKHREAIGILQKALEFVEDPVDIWAMIGMEYLYLDDYENARLNFAKCIDVDFEDYSSLYNIVYCFEMEESYEESITFLNTYIDKNPYSEVAWHQLGKQYYELNNFEQALKAFEYAVLIDETFIGGYLEKAKTLENLGRYDEAIQNYLLTLELDDPTAYAYIRIGECYEKIEARGTAVEYYKKAVYEDPLLDRGWLLLTNAYHQDGDYHKAIYYINKALQIDDTNPMYWRKYAEINIKLSFYEEAVKAFNNCIDLGDLDIEIYIALADVLLFLGEFKDGLKVLLKGRKMYKDFAEIEYRLCGMFMINNKNTYALNHLENGLNIDFEFHDILKELFPSVYKTDEVQALISNYKVKLS
ncbi:tetratricopeptide repeat protein [Tenacibaculum agarivorans]|uniref:tetratricopeptide repeat protein n=1 Tax=Tenacibaculum agarivorans TaxID=1908389 RepID=UPI00094BB272|nr:tetratricopeptide repeat protein [Tenacibaculum agarivorans]